MKIPASFAPVRLLVPSLDYEAGHRAHDLLYRIAAILYQIAAQAAGL